MHKTRVLRKRNAMYAQKSVSPRSIAARPTPSKFAACRVLPQTARSELAAALPHAAHKDGGWVRPLSIELRPESKAGKSGALLARAQCTCGCCALCAEREVANG